LGESHGLQIGERGNHHRCRRLPQPDSQGLDGVHSSSCIPVASARMASRTDVELNISAPPGYVTKARLCWLEESMTEMSSVLGEGRQMPGFELPDEGGRRRKLLGYLDEGPVILVFYRGDW
jgi:hypothetical protein